jgi:(2Fe-2S) ferredoxin
VSPIKSIEELKALRDKYKNNMDIREAGESEENIKVIIGMATCGIAAGARETMMAMLEEVNKQNIKNVTIIQSGCMGSCYCEPTVEVRYPGHEPILYGNVTPEKGREIVEKHLKNGELVQNLIVGRPFETI